LSINRVDINACKRDKTTGGASEFIPMVARLGLLG